MCGIAGLFDVKGRIEPPLLRGMLDAMKHRGPDDEGYVFFSRDGVVTAGHTDTLPSSYAYPSPYSPRARLAEVSTPQQVALGHRRLSILDLTAAGHQPMCSPDGRVWVVFNGEIYNYLELREELRGRGHAFTSGTDTEVLLHAYLEWSTACLDRLNGMWAFVIYDAREGKFFGARDRIGVKPLYYWTKRGLFAFSSEIKPLLTLPFVKPALNEEAAFDYLILHREEYGEESFFSGIYELKPSHFFRLDTGEGRMEKKRYYTLDAGAGWETFSPDRFDGMRSEVRDLITRAVDIRLRSDVPVGSCLSGGVDSSVVVCTVNDILRRRSLEQVGHSQKVFTASFPGDGIDESDWAGRVVRATRTEWHRTRPSWEGLAESLEDLVRVQEIPFGSTSIFAQYMVMRRARDAGIKVLLDGQGGDELFAGYNSFYRAFFAELIGGLRFGALFNEFGKLDNAPLGRRDLMGALAKTALGKILPRRLGTLYLRTHRPEYGYYSRDFIRAHIDRCRGFRERAFTSLNGMLRDTLTSWNLKSLLRYEDRNSMAFSIETRTPFADDRPLIEYLFGVPSAYKIHDGWSKYILREAMAGIIPDEIRTRRDKLAFSTPEPIWLHRISRRLKRYVTDDLERFINVSRIHRDWDDLFRVQATQNRVFLWKLVNFAIWKKLFGV
jgi:asparagine synthase (glutamine-hydrolysing)